MSHIPGPYRLADYEPRIYAPCFPDRDALVAIVYGYPKGADPMAWPTARLFAAAPDLLAACEALALLADSLTEDEWLCYMPHGTEFQRALPLVRAALAKAKGESQ